MIEIEEPDWEAIELDYRAGVLTVQQLCDKYGVTRGQIMGKSYRQKWTRDLAPRIAARRESKLAVASASALGLPVPDIDSATNIGERQAAEAETIESAAELQTRVTIKHRRTITKTAQLCDQLIDELSHQALSRDELAHVVELVAIAQGQSNAGDYDQAALNKKMDAWVKLLSLDARTDTLKKLVDSMQKLVNLERVVYGIEERKSAFQPGDGEGDSAPASNAVQYTPNEVARRLAFALIAGTRNTNTEK